MLKGHIISAGKDLYEIADESESEKTIIARGRGLFRNIKISPMVGDYVEYEEAKDSGHATIVNIKERKNMLLRPPVANVDMVLVLVSLQEPDINRYSLDKMLTVLEKRGFNILICLNKTDKGKEMDIDSFIEDYQRALYKVYPVNSLSGQGVDPLLEALKNKTTAIAGPSGAGKSTFIRLITGSREIITGSVSKKTGRGKQTTRTSRLFRIDKASYIFDTPGFSSLDLRDFETGMDLKDCFREFREPAKNCRFRDCSHRKEPGCGVLKKLENGQIAKSRYKSYLALFDEIEKNRLY